MLTPPKAKFWTAATAIGRSFQGRGMADHGAALIRLFQVERRGDKAVLHQVEGEDGLDGAAGAHGMPHVPL